MKFHYLITVLLIFGCKSKTTTEIEKPSYELKIAYNVAYDEEADDYEVFIMDLDGKNKKNLTNLGGVEWTYYAYDDDIYYISDVDTIHRNYFLYKMKPDGSGKKKVSDIRLADSWMNTRYNGTEIIVLPHKTIDSAFYILNSEGKIIKRLKPDLKYIADPAFSPDGSQIAFRGAHYKSKREKEFVDEIYVMNADGSNLKQLTHYPEADTTAMWYAYKAGPPKWHPTENFISYSSFQNGKYSLFGISLDGEKQWKLTNDKEGEVYHDWSPDGKWLVTDRAVNDNIPFHIALVSYKTKETKILTDSTHNYHQSPVFVKVYK